MSHLEEIVNRVCVSKQEHHDNDDDDDKCPPLMVKEGLRTPYLCLLNNININVRPHTIMANQGKLNGNNEWLLLAYPLESTTNVSPQIL